jgi:hypothetical protein
MTSSKEDVAAEEVKVFHTAIRLACAGLVRNIDLKILDKNRVAEELKRAALFLTDAA